MRKKINHVEIIFLIGISFIAFFINFYTASRGVFPVDTFLHYDNGFRIILGENPIKDYWIVHGFLIDYLQAIFFKIFGNSWTSYIIHSSIFNLSICLFSYYILRILKIDRNISLFLIISLAFLSYPVSGTPFLDLHSSYFSLFGIYFAILGIIKEKNILWFWAAFFLCIAFFCKQVPAGYTIIFITFLVFLFATQLKRIKIIYYYILGSVTFLFLFLFFLILKGIPLQDFILQIFLFPQSIGTDRYINYALNFKNVFLDYKFIHIPLLSIVTLNIYLFKKNKKFHKSKYFQIFLILFFYTLSTLIHQFYTKNQIYIFFLIPILIGFFFYFIENLKFKNKKRLKYLFIFLCLFCTIKYHERFNSERKFHELSNTNIKNGIEIKNFDNKFRGLKWISPYYKNPEEEINNLILLYDLLKIDNSKKMLLTEYQFFSSLLEEKLYSPSRTYDDISFPVKKSKYFQRYKQFLIDKININEIKNIYILESKKINDKRLDHLIFNYVSKNCFDQKIINSVIRKLEIKKCKDLGTI